MEQRDREAIVDAMSAIAAQIEDLVHETRKQRFAVENLAETMPGVLEALRNLYEVVPVLERLADKE